MAAAVTAGTIHRPNNHISRTPLLLDSAGYRQLVDLLDKLLAEVIELQQRSAARMARGDEAILAKVHIIQFPSPSVRNRVIPTPANRLGCQPPDLSDDAIFSALEHPTRVHALMVLNERLASAAEIGRELGRSSDHVSYHLKKLRKLGLIATVNVQRNSQGRIAGQYYRALIRPWFDHANWQRVCAKRQTAITSTMLALCNADMAEAARAGTINDPDSHISRTPIIVDQGSYGDLLRLLDTVIEELFEIEQQSIERHEEQKHLASKVHLFLFESPDPARAQRQSGE